MPKIPGSDWYTAAQFKKTPISGSERCTIGIAYGYRRSLKGVSPEEIEAQIQTLKYEGIIAKKSVSAHNHTDIPAGTPFLEVFDEKSVQNLETQLGKMGIDLPIDRFEIYKQNLQMKGGR